FSSTRRLFIAYGYCLIIICISSPFVRSFINEKTWQPHVDSEVRGIQDIHHSEPVYAYAATPKEIPENNYRTVLPFVLIATIPSYVWSYSAFIVTTFLTKRALRIEGVQLSTKTIGMQRRFLRMQLLQGLVPLAITAIPVSIFIGTMIAGVSMDRWSILHTFAIHAVPIVQALVSFTYVRQMSRKNAELSSGTK
ncbi:hypothetical protein PFISCL1PPCAC_7429, partial [Pristionchus fissidentatus]